MVEGEFGRCQERLDREQRRGSVTRAARTSGSRPARQPLSPRPPAGSRRTEKLCNYANPVPDRGEAVPDRGKPSRTGEARTRQYPVKIADPYRLTLKTTLELEIIVEQAESFDQDFVAFANTLSDQGSSA